MRNFDTSLLQSEPNGVAVGRGGVLPKPEIPLTTKDLLGIDLTHIIHTNEVFDAKPGGGGHGGGGGGGGGGMSFGPYTAGATNGAAGYDITINFIGSNWTQALHDDFTASADFYASLIVGDVQDVKVVGGKGGPQTIDDIVINAELTTIDGEGGILGQAGPTSVRTSGSLPATATMQFDIADASYYEGQGLFNDIVFHEMGHSIGFGSIWDRLGLVDSSGHFTGTNAQAESLEDFKTSTIYVEQDGGSGTAGSHWDEATYGNEIMTGYINPSNFLSDMTAASYADLGYQIAANFETLVADFVV